MNNKAKLLTLLFGAMIFISGCGIVLAYFNKESPVRVINISARDMNFYVDDIPDKNPTIRLIAGEVVKLKLKNIDPGMKHDFLVGELEGFNIKVLSDGESAEIIIKIPSKPGLYTYFCSFHQLIMRGTIEII